MTDREYMKSVYAELQKRNIPHVFAVLIDESEEEYNCMRGLFGPANIVQKLSMELAVAVLKGPRQGEEKE
jgi:hypothetical protein